MKHQLLSDGCLDALREDLPTSADERRIRARLVGIGLGVTLAVAPQAASAALKVGIWSGLATRFATLPLLTQMVLVAGGTAVVATPAVVAYQQSRTSALVTSGDGVAILAGSSPVAVESDGSPAAAKAPEVPLDIAFAPKIRADSLNAESAASARKVVAESKLAEEAQLLDAALAAIRSGELIRAGQLIERHESRYPDGRLTAERERARRKLIDALAVRANAR
jgi:hypothetical protein